MKKLLIALCAASLLIGCSSKEQTGLKESLVAKFKDDQDLKDYKLDPADVADCVVKQIAETMPGFGGDPRRDQYYEAYARFINAKSPGELQKAETEYAQLFGSAKKAGEAAANVTTYNMDCMGKAIEQAGSRAGGQNGG